MIRLVRIELLKLRTTPAPWLALIVVLGLSVAAVVSSIYLAGRSGNAALGTSSNVSKALAVAAASSLAMLILGIMISAGEDRHRTNIGTYLGEPRRDRVLVAKLLAAAFVGAVAGAVLFGAALALALVVYASRGVHHLPVNIAGLWIGTVLVTAAFGLLGVSLGALTRNTVASIVSAIVWVLVIELGILATAAPGVAKWFPSSAGEALTTAGGNSRLLSTPVAALTLLAWAAGISLVASRVSLRREVR